MSEIAPCTQFLLPTTATTTNPTAPATTDTDTDTDTDSGLIRSTSVEHFPALYRRGYRNLRNLLHCRFGYVKTAVSPCTGVSVCVKITLLSAWSAEAEEDVRLEAAILRNLHHPAIIEYIDSFEDGTYHYLVTEHACRGDLLQQAVLSEEVARTYFAQLVNAIDYLHNTKNIAHVDVSMENVCLARDGSLRLIDFGVARVVPASGVCDACNVIPGKFRYSSEEVIMGRPWDPRANDLYALGVLLFTMMTGRQVIECANPSVDPWYAYVSSGRWLQVRGARSCRFYEHLSSECKQLIDGLIKPESHRWTLQQVKDCKWLQLQASGSSSCVSK